MYPLKNTLVLKRADFLEIGSQRNQGELREVWISGHFWQDWVNSVPFSSDEPNSLKSSPFLERLTKNESSPPVCDMLPVGERFSLVCNVVEDCGNSLNLSYPVQRSL